MIICNLGHQRTGKTLVSVYLSRKLKEIYPDIDLWANMQVEGFQRLEKISQVMYNKHKIVIIDEAYLNFDSRKFKSNADISLFLNTLGKQKTMLIVTSPRLDMLDKRLREQAIYNFVSYKGHDDNYIYFRIYDNWKDILSKEYKLYKDRSLFDYCKYDTHEIPNIIQVDV